MATGRFIRQLGSETIIYGVSGTVSRFIGVFLIPLYTRVFDPTEYGVYALTTSVLGLLSTVVILGLDNSSARWFYDSDDEIHRRSVIAGWFWCQIVASFAVALILCLSASWVSARLLGSGEYGPLLQLVALLVFLSTFSKVLGNWLRYRRQAWMTSLLAGLSSLGTVGFTLLFVVTLRKGLAGVYLGQSVVGVAVAIVAIVAFRSWISPRRVSFPILKRMLVFGFPLALSNAGIWVTASSDKIILQAYRPTSEVGIYAIAVSLSSAMALVTGAFQMAWGPFAFSILSQPESNRIYSKVFSIYSLVGCLIATTFSVFSPLLLRVFTTPEYYPAASSVPFLVFANLIMGATYIAVLGSSIVKKSTPIALSVVLGAAVSAGLNFLLIPRFGRDAAGFSALFSALFQFAFLFIASQRLYPIGFRLRDGVVCLGLSVGILLVNQFVLAPSGWVGYLIRGSLCLLFVPLAFLLQIVTPDHIRAAVVAVRVRSPGRGH